MRAFRARYLFPVDSPPVRDGVVAFDGERIVAIGDGSSPAIRDLLPAARDLGNAAILPGLVNPHTHLEFSDLREPLGMPGMAFPDWIRLAVKSRRDRPVDEDSIARGIAESLSHGVTALGEIASTPWWKEPPQPLEITEFVESIGLRRDEAEAKFAQALDAMSDSRWSKMLRPAFSPHAPYSVHLELLQRLVRLSAERKLPVAHHLAESREELELLRDGTGPFVELLQDFGVWGPDAIVPGARPLDYLKMLSGADRTLVIHGNYLDDEAIGYLAAHAERMSVVYCPRTHAYFRHDPYPLEKMLAAGVNVALGTDSRASSPDLNPLAEMRFAAAQHPKVSPAAMLQMITTNAAGALGRAEEIGTLAPGKRGDLTIVQLPEQNADDPHELLLDPTCRVVSTIFRGNSVYG